MPLKLNNIQQATSFKRGRFVRKLYFSLNTATQKYCEKNY